MTRTVFRACLAALALVPVAASPDETAKDSKLFIQGSEVNLRSEASKTAEIAAKVAIGTACTEAMPKPADKAWVKLQCQDKAGFTLRALVAPEPPDFGKLLERATAKGAPAQARYDAAMRAASLRPDSSEALAALRHAFFDLQFLNLKVPEYELAWERVSLGLVSAEHALVAPEGDDLPPDEKLILDLGFESRGFDFRDMVVRKKLFVLVVARLGKLHTVTGRLRRSDPEDGADIFSYDEWDLNDTLSKSLATISEANPHGDRGTGPLWPYSTDAVRFVGNLPARWFRLTGIPGHRERVMHRTLREHGCFDVTSGFSISLVDHTISAGREVLHADANGNKLQLTLQDKVTRKPTLLTLEWPTTEEHVGFLNNAPYTPFQWIVTFPAQCSFIGQDGDPSDGAALPTSGSHDE